MPSESPRPEERTLELRDLATGEVRRFAVVREETTPATAMGVERVGHAAPTATSDDEARIALEELYGGPIDLTDEEHSAIQRDLHGE